MLEKSYSDIAINMYNELHEYEQKSLFQLGNYANALVMQGKYDEAMYILAVKNIYCTLAMSFRVLPVFLQH